MITSLKEDLLQRIYNRQILVGIIGLGYVGLPLAVEHAKAGFTTIGFDVQAEKVADINNGINYIADVNTTELNAMITAGKLAATNDFSFLSKVDYIAICVPTPLDTHQQPDLSYIEQSTEIVACYLKKGAVVVLESTTYPGTTEELIRPMLEKGSGLVCCEDFYLGFSPERIDPGNPYYKTNNTPKVVGCIGNEATTVIKTMYNEVLGAEIYAVSSPKVAEMEKILENTYRNINIALANEMAVICNKMDINVWEVIDAAKSKPYGFQAFYPGPGLGGHCIPLDPYYLTWKAKEFDCPTKLIYTAGEINSSMPNYVIDRCTKLLSQHGMPLQAAKILVLGIAYKNDIKDYRESASLKIIEKLRLAGGAIDFYDSYVAKYYCKKNGEQTGISELSAQSIKKYDLVLIATAHSNIDYEMVVNNASLIFDCRNATKAFQPKDNIAVL
ncbi:MAG: nucleotide sugar dehydrogenase [Oscillospiraceae bacterium]